MNRAVKAAVAVGIVMVVAIGAFWYFVLREDAPPPADLSVLDDELAAGDTAPEGPAPEDTASEGTASEGAVPEGLDGTWEVVMADDAFAGYRIDELYGVGATVKTTAAGRTGDVTGSVTVEGTTVTDATFEVDVTTLESDRSRRDDVLRFRGLETDDFPTATFELTAPIVLDALPAEDEEVTVIATGDLTLHGETRPVTLELGARWSGDRISIEGSTDIELADFGIEAISIPSFVQVDDHGTVEFVLLLERAH